MRLFKRGDVWWFDVTVEGDRYRQSTKRSDRKSALAVASDFVKRKLDEAQLGVRYDWTLEEVADSYLLDRVRHTSRSTMEARVRRLFGRSTDGSPLHGGKAPRLNPKMRVSRFTNREIDRYKAERLAEGASANTVRSELTVLRAMLRLADRHGGAVRPGLEFKTPKAKAKLRYLLPGEEVKLLEALDPMRQANGITNSTNPEHPQRRVLREQYELVVFLLDTGCRYSEATSVTWTMVDTDNWEWINLYRKKVDNESTLAMTKRLASILKRRYLRRAGGQYVFPAVSNTGRVSKGPRQYATEGITKAIERAGLNAPHLVDRYGRFTPHSLRDSFAAKLAQAGVSLYHIQKFLGHASPVQTQKYASLCVEDASRQAVRVLDQINGDFQTGTSGAITGREAQ